ncbi:MAG TPA: hypothetical protein VG939_21050 [Caulobacteraceae bacterium]|nr:hypothetical protein [Caulobacteraceae bacterium]
MDIQLNFINQSNDQNNSDVVIFQKNVTTDFDEIAVAWQVIKNCGQGDNHPFVYPSASAVSCKDAWGNYTPKLAAEPGQLFAMVKTASGDELELQGSASSPVELQVANDLPQGAIDAGVYKSGRLIAQKAGVAPQQKAVFQFKPTLWIGVASEVDEGEILNAAIISQIDTELSLLGVASADIVMTGGGVGINSTPYKFSLQNVVMA